MEVSVENTSTLGRRLKVSVAESTVAEEIKKKIAKFAKEAHIKGFRRGKVPLSVIEKKFGKSIRSEVINELIQSSWEEAIKEKDLKPAGSPKFEEVKLEEGQDLEYTATFEVYPQITLADLSMVEIEKRSVEITDEDVNNMIGKLQNELADWEEVEREVQNQDKLTVDFARLLKKEGAERQEQKNVQIIVGGEGVLPELSQTLLNKKKGEEIQMDLRYPSDWAEEAVAGEETTLWITIHTIAEKHKLNDSELARKLGVDEESEPGKLREQVRDRMEVELDQALHEELREKVLEKLLEKNPIEIPYGLIEQEKKAIRQEMMRGRRGKVPDHLLHSGEVENSAKRRVELGLLLNEVIKKHNLKADLEQVREQVTKIASNFSNPAQITEAYYSNKELLYGAERVVLLDLAVDAILKETKVIEKKASFDEVMNPK